MVGLRAAIGPQKIPKSKNAGRAPRYPLGWLVAVMRSWPDETFPEIFGRGWAGDHLFLRFATNQCFFCTIVGLLVLVPSYRTGRGLAALEDSERGDRWSFSLNTVLNIKCRFAVNDDEAEEVRDNLPLFPGCANGHSDFQIYPYCFVCVAVHAPSAVGSSGELSKIYAPAALVFDIWP